MNPPLLRIVLTIPLALAMAACSESAAPDPAAPASEPAERPVPERTAEAVESGAVYSCSDGTAIRIDSAALKAIVTPQNGNDVTLPRAESASKGGGDVFVGETLSVLREGRTAQLHRNEGPAIACSAP